MAYKVYLSPSSQTGNPYATGKTNEAEQCGKIAEACRAALERCGIAVKVGHLITLAQKCQESDSFGANLHVPIHTNAASNGTQSTVAGTRLFAMQKGAGGWKACEAISKYLFPLTPGSSENIKEHTGLYEINVPKASTAYIECEFHDNPTISDWIISHTTEIGEAIAHGICDYAGVGWKEASSAIPPLLDDGPDDLPATDKDAILAFLRENRAEVIKILFGI